VYRAKDFVPWVDGSPVSPVPTGFKFTTAEQGTGYYRDIGQGQVRMACGDVFGLSKGGFEQFDAAYDRGSLVAIEPDLRIQ
jgi:hypothetical protein